MTRPLRIIQWATGNVGRHAVAAVHERPDLELVGALVHSDAEAGRDRCAAAPGIRTFLDLPTIAGRGLLSPPGAAVKPANPRRASSRRPDDTV